jgi:hypothetical protein
VRVRGERREVRGGGLLKDGSIDRENPDRHGGGHRVGADVDDRNRIRASIGYVNLRPARANGNMNRNGSNSYGGHYGVGCRTDH